MFSTRLALSACVAALSLATMSAGAQTAAQNKTSTAPADARISAMAKKMAAMTPVQFADKVATSDRFEIETSQMALKKTKDEKLRDYANMMIEDHGKSTKQLTQIAGAKKIKPTPKLDAEQQKMMTELKGAAAVAAFEQAYLKGQVAGHERTLATLQAYSDRGTDAKMKGFAKQMIPIVQRHLEEARTLQGNMTADTR